MNIGQCSAIPFAEDINCYYTHKVLSLSTIEQIGFAESLMHVITLPSNQDILKQMDNDEIIIDSSSYDAAKNLLEYLIIQAKETIENLKAIEKTNPVKGTCFRHGAEIGMVTGQPRNGSKTGFSGLRLHGDNQLNSFLVFVDPEEFQSDDYEQIEPDIYTRLSQLYMSTYLSIKSTIKDAMKKSIDKR